MIPQFPLSQLFSSTNWFVYCMRLAWISINWISFSFYYFLLLCFYFFVFFFCLFSLFIWFQQNVLCDAIIMQRAPHVQWLRSYRLKFNLNVLFRIIWRYYKSNREADNFIFNDKYFIDKIVFLFNFRQSTYRRNRHADIKNFKIITLIIFH